MSQSIVRREARHTFAACMLAAFSLNSLADQPCTAMSSECAENCRSVKAGKDLGALASMLIGNKASRNSARESLGDTQAEAQQALVMCANECRSQLNELKSHCSPDDFLKAASEMARFVTSARNGY